MNEPIEGIYKEYIYDSTEPAANGAYNKYIEVQSNNRNLVEKNIGFYLHMGNGDVDRDEFPIPKCLTKTLVNSVKNNYYRYSHPLGRPTTRQLIAEYENFIAGVDRYEQKNIGVVLSATGGFAASIEILIRHNEFNGEVLIMQPTYPVYEAVLWNRFGIKKIVGKEENGFLPTPEEIKANINDKTKFIIITSPNFPFGKTYSMSDLEQIVDLSNEKKVYIIFDEIFYDLPFIQIPNIGLIRKSQKYIIRIKGFSKDRSVPGFRIGYVIADEAFINKLNSYTNHYYGFPPSLFEPFIEKDIIMRMLMKGKRKIETTNSHDLPQIAEKKLRILGDSKKDLSEYKKNILGNLQKFRQNRDSVIKLIKDIPQMEVIVPDAGFNLGVKIKHKGNSFNLFQDIFFNTGVVLAPGDVFDMPASTGNWFRLTFSNNLEKMEKALFKIKEHLKKH